MACILIGWWITKKKQLLFSKSRSVGIFPFWFASLVYESSTYSPLKSHYYLIKFQYLKIKLHDFNNKKELDNFFHASKFDNILRLFKNKQQHIVFQN